MINVPIIYKPVDGFTQESNKLVFIWWEDWIPKIIANFSTIQLFMASLRKPPLSWSHLKTNAFETYYCQSSPFFHWDVKYLNVHKFGL